MRGPRRPGADASADAGPGTAPGSSDDADASDGPTTSPVDGSSTDAPTGDSSDGSSSDTSTGEPAAMCGDGVTNPGELCFDDLLLIEPSDVVFDARLTDVDSDGDVDVVYLIGDQIVTHLGTGEGAFGPALYGETVFEQAADVGDVDGDGRVDLAMINRYDNTLEIALGDGVGGFALQVPPLATSAAPALVRVADLDGDAGVEVIVGTDSAVEVFRSDGDGSPQPGFGVGVGGPVLSLGLGEYDGDGDPDLLYVREAYGNQELFVRLGDGDGTFGSQVMVDVDGDTPRGVAGGDFDGDGDGDIAYVDAALGMLYIHLGNGAGGFADATGVPTDAGPAHTLAEDVTGDGTARDVARGRELFATYCKDDAVACGEYGSLFLGGVGVAQDTGMAHLLLGLACDHGEAAACRDLALVLDAGCAQRHGPSCNERGVMAAQGRGAEPDAAAAFSLFERSCAIDDANGCSNLAKAYAGGHGVTADSTRAAEESARACRLGSQPDCEAAVTDGSPGR